MTTSQLRAAVYARVSSPQQADANTIVSQVEALRDRVRSDGLKLDAECSFLDEGHSGATLLRPALERLRDQAAAGAIDRLYVHSPDRLARSYAYQVVLLEEFRRGGVEVVFLNRPIGRSPEEDLLLQVQGMMAEYERAKIAERSRRGKRHAARGGSVNVLSGAPYGYRYVGKLAGGGRARYEVHDEHAAVVRQLFDWVGVGGHSIGNVCRRLQEKKVPSPKGKAFWDRTTVWGILRNPAYAGRAEFGKTRVGPARPKLRPQRGRPAHGRRAGSTDEAPADERVPIVVPALVDEGVFAAVAEQLATNRTRRRESRRGAKYLLQGLVVCGGCGYAFYGKPLSRSSRKGKTRHYAYYRCIGTDAYRFGGQRVCEAKQCRTDVLDKAVWDDACALLADPDRVRREYEARRSRTRSKGTRPSDQVGKLIAQVKRGIARLIDAYEEGLLDKAEFEPRVREAKARLAKLQGEAEAAAKREADEVEVATTIGQLEGFADRIRAGLQDAGWDTRREVLRALVKRVEVGTDAVKVVYKVSPRPFDQGPERGSSQDCWRGDDTPLRGAARRAVEETTFKVPRFQPLPEHRSVRRDVPEQPVVVDVVEAALDVPFQYPRGVLPHERLEALLHRVRARSPRPEPVGVLVPGRLGYRVEGEQVEGLHRPVPDRRYPEGTAPAVRLRDVHPPQGTRLVAASPERVNRVRLLRRRVPDLSAHAGGVLTVALGDSLHGKGLAAARVGQQTLQGSHLVPSAFPRRLHDTGLEPTHRRGGRGPVDAVPRLHGA
jgi:site-specific DNA recombinase